MKGGNITLICTVSATGSYILSMFIYLRQRTSSELCKYRPTEATWQCSKNGWTIKNYLWHGSNTISFFCMCIPPQTSHGMQHLNVAFHRTLKPVFWKGYDLFMKSHTLQTFFPYNVASIFNREFFDMAAIQKGASTFEASGILPIHPCIFGDEHFLILLK